MSPCARPWGNANAQNEILNSIITCSKYFMARESINTDSEARLGDAYGFGASQSLL